LSHLHERKEKVCLNCGASLIGRYCQDCGQENLEPKESAWHLIVHFFNDITHFDGKFFKTIKLLLAHPGFLTEEYMKGRRARHINPIRMYLFVSALFFLLFMSFFSDTPSTVQLKDSSDTDTVSTTKKVIGATRRLATSLDSMEYEGQEEIIVLLNGDSITRKQLDENNPRTVKAFDSLQALLPKTERMGSIWRHFARKAIVAGERKKRNSEEFKSQFRSNYYHSLPYMLFFALPLVALFFRLVYVRRKDFNYVSHAIFIVHFTCVVFIVLLAKYTVETFGKWGNYLSIVLSLYLIGYLYMAMLKFYRQGKFKTFVKFVLLSTISATIIGLLTLALVINSAFDVI
jgi:hypothetical protein